MRLFFVICVKADHPENAFGVRIGGDGGGVGLVAFNSIDEYVRSDGASGISAGIHWVYGGYSDAAFAGSPDSASASGK